MSAERGTPVSLDEFFDEQDPLARELFEAIREKVESLGEVYIRVTKSQIAFRRASPFAWAWMSSRYLGRREYFAPLVLSIGLRRRETSPRWKQVVEPRPGLFMHHLELRSVDEIDDEVLGWLREAWEQAG